MHSLLKPRGKKELCSLSCGPHKSPSVQGNFGISLKTNYLPQNLGTHKRDTRDKLSNVHLKVEVFADVNWQVQHQIISPLLVTIPC